MQTKRAKISKSLLGDGQRRLGGLMVSALLLLIFTLSACRSVSRIERSTFTDSTFADSGIVTEVKERFVPVVVPGDSAVIDVPLVVDSAGQVRDLAIENSGPRVGAKVIIRGNRLQVKCECQEWKDSVKVLDSTIRSWNSKIRLTHAATEIETTVIKYRTPTYIKVILGVVSVLLIIAGLVLWGGNSLTKFIFKNRE